MALVRCFLRTRNERPRCAQCLIPAQSKKENEMRILKFLLLLSLFASVPVLAQGPPPPPTRSPAELDQLVARIALYPDPLVAQILAGATYPDQIPDAARWAD